MAKLADLQQRLRNLPWLLPGLICLLLLAATFWVWQWQKDIENTALTEELNRHSAGYTTSINERLQLHAQFLRSIQAFASTHTQLDETAWQTFSDEVEALEHLDGMYAFAYAPALNPASGKVFTVDMQKSLKNEKFRIYPNAQQDLMLPVSLISPGTAQQKKAIGFDMYSEQSRRQAIDSAIATRDVAMTGRVFLVNDEHHEPGFVLIKAIYRAGLPLNNVSSRRTAFSGIIIAGYRANDFFKAISRNLENRFILQIYDDGSNERASADAQPQLLYTSDPAFAPTSSQTPLHHEIQFGNRNWILLFHPRIDNNNAAFSTPSLVLIAGSCLSILLSLLIFHQSTHRNRAETYARQLTTKLSKSEERFRLAAAGTNDGLWDQNLETGEEFISPRLGEIFGFSRSDMPHFIQDFTRRIHPEDEPRRIASLRRHFTHMQPFDVTVRIRKRDGEQAWIRIRGEAVRNATGRAKRLAGSISDVTPLHLAEEELRAHRDHLQKLVNERTTRLELALQEATLANQAKSEFLANMSHELRTPMHAIMSFSHLGQSRASAAQETKLQHYFERISLSANRLLALINDLLDLAKLESGKQTLELVTVNLVSLSQSILAQLEGLLLARQLNCSLDPGDAAELTLLADRKLIERVIHNLLSNAIKFSPPGGCIRLVFRAEQLPNGRRSDDQGASPAISLELSDTGPGIPEAELESIFEKFNQSSRTKTGAGGTGLGLAICREAVIRHHGTITVFNNQTGGATFKVTLPCHLPLESTPA